MKYAGASKATLELFASVWGISLTTPSMAGSFFDNLLPTGLEIGLSLSTAPSYEGSDEHTVQMMPVVDPMFDNSAGPQQGIYAMPSMRYVPERIASDHADLAGLDDVDAAYEVGGTLGYRYEWVSAFVTVRYGFGGYSGLVGEAGVDLALQPFRGTTLLLGPRLSFAGEEYMDTYFGVSVAEAISSGLVQHDPNAGLKGVGLDLSVRQQLTNNWAITGALNYTALTESAGDSPIVTSGGMVDQVTARLGVLYSF
jgi:MipA family protein